LHDLNSPAGVEHVGLDVPSGETFTLFRLTREHGDWIVTALLGREGRQHLFEGGETIVVALDQSASMYQFYVNGAVARLVAAIQEEAREFRIPALRIAFSSDQRARVVQSTADIADVISNQVAANHFTTGADCVVTARNALADAGSGSKITVLVTDSPPVGDLADIVARSRTVVAVLGLDQDGEKVDAARWARLRSTGAPVVPFGEVHQATDEIVGLLSDAVHA
jgi:TusA-related sulfurtransferase